MKKYEFIKKDIDNYVLKYKDKEFEFSSTIGITSKIQKHQEQAEFNLITDLAKKGMTINDLKIQKVENGKKYVDESNYNEIINKYKTNALNEAIDEVCLEVFNMRLVDLAVDIGLENADDGVIFATDLFNYLTGNTDTTPSKTEETNN